MQLQSIFLGFATCMLLLVHVQALLGAPGLLTSNIRTIQSHSSRALSMRAEESTAAATATSRRNMLRSGATAAAAAAAVAAATVLQPGAALAAKPMRSKGGPVVSLPR
jgi:hypothetical protein